MNERLSVDAAAQEIVSKEGCVGIPDLASHAGLSSRQFERRFADVLGISPKLYARIIRFEAAVRKKAVSSCINWTTVAHELGYHDQMHMIHDFQLLSGESPTSLAPHLESLALSLPNRRPDFPVEVSIRVFSFLPIGKIVRARTTNSLHSFWGIHPEAQGRKGAW